MLIAREPVRDDAAAAPTRSAVPGTRCLRSDELLEGRRDVLIQHGTEVYRLSQTRSGKLILTK